MYLPRALQDRWFDASQQFPVLLLTGPRQVGKTTLLRHAVDAERRYVTLDDPVLRGMANEEPALFLQRFPAPVLIDEIQYAPALLPYLKMAVDTERRPGAFWLTGSQQFHLMRGVSETLAGRIAIVHLLGFSNRERHQLPLDVPPLLPTPEMLTEREKSAAETSLSRVYEDIFRGSFPSLVAGPVTDRDLFYSSYLQTYLERDVRDLAQVGNEAAFVRFLRACAARTGQLLNLSELARDTGVQVNTAKSWLSILQTSFQVFLLQPYHTNLSKRLIKTPKLYFLDTGLCAYLTQWSSPETLEAGAMSGAIFETYVLSELLKSWWHRMQAPEIYYYRDKDGREIDFLLVKDGTLFPLEVKRSASPHRDWTQVFSSLRRFSQPVGHGGVVCLYPQLLPLTADATAVPVGLI
jgi:predicted AAA+ superfamily ATPase